VTTWVDRVVAEYDDAAVGASVDATTEPVSVDVDVERWAEAVAIARDALGCTFFDWLSAVDETDTLDGFRLVCHVAAHQPGTVDHLVVRTLVPLTRPVVASVADLYAGARWHERETHEMFGIDFTADGAVLTMEPLLLPAEFVGHPLRKEFVLATRVATPWPGEKEPGESESTPMPTRSRRRARPLGVPEPGTWGHRDDGE
jgi:NADH:ubiquinone oxidoreductase subunit C